MPRFTRSRVLVILGVASLALSSFVNGAAWVESQTSSWPNRLVLTPSVTFLAVPVLFFGAFGVLLFAISIRVAVLRQLAVVVLVSSSLYLLVGAPLLVSAHRIHTIKWRNGFENLAERGDVLVTAIGHYEAKYKMLPPNLDTLAPEFLAFVPKTEFGEYEYIHDDSTPSRFSGNRWILQLHVSASVPFGRETFIYYPNQDYSEFKYRSEYAQMRDWVLVLD